MTEVNYEKGANHQFGVTKDPNRKWKKIDEVKGKQK